MDYDLFDYYIIACNGLADKEITEFQRADLKKWLINVEKENPDFTLISGGGIPSDYSPNINNGGKN